MSIVTWNAETAPYRVERKYSFGFDEHTGELLVTQDGEGLSGCVVARLKHSASIELAKMLLEVVPDPNYNGVKRRVAGHSIGPVKGSD